MERFGFWFWGVSFLLCLSYWNFDFLVDCLWCKMVGFEIVGICFNGNVRMSVYICDLVYIVKRCGVF